MSCDIIFARAESPVKLHAIPPRLAGGTNEAYQLQILYDSRNEKAQTTDADHRRWVRRGPGGRVGLDERHHEGREIICVDLTPGRYKRYHSDGAEDDRRIRQLLGRCETGQPRV